MENGGLEKILGEWWSLLEDEEDIFENIFAKEDRTV